MEPGYITWRCRPQDSHQRWSGAIIGLTLHAILWLATGKLFGQAGQVDEGFMPDLPADSRAGWFLPLPDGGTLVVVEPTTPPWQSYILRWLRQDGSAQRSFSLPMEPRSSSHKLALSSVEGKLLISGGFTFSNSRQLTVIQISAQGDIDPTFHQADFTGGGITALRVQPDGRILVCGNFTQVDGAPRNGIARLEINGDLDPSFQADLWFGSEVSQAEVLGSGQILIVGNFDASPGLARRGIARLSSNGAVDRRWTPAVPESSQLSAIAVQSDQKMLIGGSSGLLMRLNVNGTRDSSFQTGTAFGTQGLAAWVKALAIQPQDGKILVGGAFETYRGTYAEGLVRLASNGAIDLAFDAGAIFPGDGLNTRVEQIAIARGGELMVSGSFTTIGGRSRPGLARLIGGNETNQVPRFQFATFDLSVTEGSTSLTGTVKRLRSSQGTASVSFHTTTNLWFTLRDAARPGIDYTETHGELVFQDGENSKTFKIPILDDMLGEEEKRFGIVLTNASPGAAFGNPTHLLVTLVDNDSAYGIVPGRRSVGESEAEIQLVLMRFGPAGNTGTVRYTTVDGSARAGLDYTTTSGIASFPPGQASLAIRIPLLSDSLREGTESFRFRLSEPTPAAALINPPAEVELNVVDDDDDGPGAVDVSFKPVHGGLVVLAPYSGGGAYVASTFDEWPITGTNAVFRLDPRGGLDPTYASPEGLFASFAHLAVRSDGEALVYGWLRSAPDADVAPGVAHLNRDGRLASLILKPEFSGHNVSVLAWDSESSFLIGFQPDSFSPPSLPALMRVNLDGSTATNFNAGIVAPQSIRAIARQTNGDWIIAGNFREIQGKKRPCLARLKPDGGIDVDFEPDIVGLEEGFWVTTLCLQPDGKLLIAGALTHVDGRQSAGLARLLPSGRADPTFHPATLKPAVVPLGGSIASLALQSNGRIVLSGWFEKVGGLSRRGLARLLPSGEVDPEFDQLQATQGSPLAISVTGDLFALAPHSVNFQNFPFVRLIQENQAFPGRLEFENSDYSTLHTAGVVTVNVVRHGGTLGAATVQCTTFDKSARAGIDYRAMSEILEFAAGERRRSVQIPVLPSAVDRLARQMVVRLEVPTGAVLGTGSETVVTIRNHRAGSLDSTFVADPILRGQVGRIGFAPDGKVFIDHSLPHNQFGTPSILRRLNEDGSMDGLFKSSIHQNLVHWVPRNDGGVYVITTDFSRLYVASVAPDGTQDRSFRHGIGFSNASVLAGPDGRLIGCRDLSEQGEGPRWKLVRLNQDGSEDSSFPSPTFGSPARLIGFSPDQGLLVQGLLLGDSRLRFWRIDSHGSVLSTAFPEDASFYGELQLLPDGGLLGFLYSPDTDAIPFQFRLRRFLDNGTEDPTFHSDVTTELGFPGAAGVVTQLDGKLLVWGSPLRYGANAAGDPLTTSVLRLWPTGAVDGIFELEPNGNAYVGQLLPDSTGGILATPLRESFTERGDLPVVRLLSNASFVLGADLLPNRTLRLKLHLALGEGVVVERSEDLQTWHIASAPLTHPTHEFLEPLSAGKEHQFYRIRINQIGPTN
jgi:uncharacterized delta-60 repeat protein